MMEMVKLSDIPEYLRDGELYKSLMENSEDPDEILTFDGTVLKKNTKVESACDCDHLLNSLRFWGVSNFCEEVAAFVLMGPSEENDQVLAKYEEQFPYARALRTIKKTYGKKNKFRRQLRDAIETGCVEVAVYITLGKCVPPTQLLPIYALENGCTVDADICACVATEGHLDCLKYLHEQGYPWDETTCVGAARHGHTDCLMYAHGHGCPWDASTCTAAAASGHLNCLQYAHEQGCKWDRETYFAATTKGHQDCKKFLRANGCARK